MVYTSDLYFRNGIDTLLKTCTELSVPLVIVSAGLSEVVNKSLDLLIEELGPMNINRDLIHVISNNSEICPDQ